MSRETDHTHKYLGRKSTKLESPYVLTGEMYDFYCERVDYWLKVFNQLNWSIYYVFEEDEDGFLAWVSYNTGGRCATFGISSVWESEKPIKEEIDKCAFHEVMEIVLSDLYSLVRSRQYVDREIDMAGHNIIRIFENVVYRNMLTDNDVKLLGDEFGEKRRRK